MPDFSKVICTPDFSDLWLEKWLMEMERDGTPRFLGPLDDRKVGPEEWELLAHLPYITRVFGAPVLIIAQKGFRTDFASIPQIVQSVISKVGPWDLPGVIHDWGFRNQPPWITRGQWNSILAEAMVAEKVPWRARWKINVGVRLGSWIAWNENKKALNKPIEDWLRS